MNRVKQNPKIPENINASAENPLSEFALMLAGVIVAIVIFVVIISFSIGLLAPLAPFSWEQRITELYSQSIDTGEIESAEFKAAEQALIELGNEVSQSIDYPEDMVFHFHLMEESTPNAFATLGGHIFVTTGLLRYTSTENALAMVLAHEMGHIKYRHPIQALGRGVLFQLMAVLITGNQGSTAVQSLLSQAGMLTLLSFNRDMEREADAEAVSALLKRYGHLAGSDEFFSRMLAEQGSTEWLEMFQTHPDVETRLTEIQQQMDSVETQSVTIPLDVRLSALID